MLGDQPCAYAIRAIAAYLTSRSDGCCDATKTFNAAENGRSDSTLTDALATARLSTRLPRTGFQERLPPMRNGSCSGRRHRFVGVGTGRRHRDAERPTRYRGLLNTPAWPAPTRNAWRLRGTSGLPQAYGDGGTLAPMTARTAPLEVAVNVSSRRRRCRMLQDLVITTARQHYSGCRIGERPPVDLRGSSPRAPVVVTTSAANRAMRIRVVMPPGCWTHWPQRSDRLVAKCGTTGK